MPCVSQALRNLTASRSTSVTWAISNTTGRPLLPILALSSTRYSERSQPISLMPVLFFSDTVSILNVTLSLVSNEWASQNSCVNAASEKGACRVFGICRTIGQKMAEEPNTLGTSFVAGWAEAPGTRRGVRPS